MNREDVKNYLKYLLSKGINLEKIRISLSPMLTYDTNHDIVNPDQSVVVNGYLNVEDPKVKFLECKQDVIIDWVELVEKVNSSTLGFVFNATQLLKYYIDDQWVEFVRYTNLDEALIEPEAYATWDYKGWGESALKASMYTQKDWNQTLMTMINNLAANVGGDARFIAYSPRIHKIIETLEYYNAEKKTLSSYAVKQNPNLSDDILIVVSDDNTLRLKIENLPND